MTNYTCCREKIVTEEGKGHLRSYKYKGGDLSYIYKYVNGPMAQFVVDKFYPPWLAPNLITFIGSIIGNAAHIWLMFLGFYSYTETIGPAVFLTQATVQFIYVIMDCSDGKQARKTGSSSPLGLLFDHGCDAVMTGVLCVIWMKMVGTGPTIWGWTIMFVSEGLFFYATLEEYFVGGLFLGVVNATTEGNWILILTAVFSAIMGGNEFFQWELIKDTGFLVMHVFYIILALFYVVTFYQNVKEGLTQTNVKTFCQKSLSVWYIQLSFIACIVFTGPEKEFMEHNYIWISYIYIIGMGRLCNALMVNHCAEEDYHIIQVPVVLLTLCVNVYTVLANVPGCLTQATANIFWISLFTVSLLYYVTYLISVVSTLARVLGIGVFTIKNKEETLALISDTPRDTGNISPEKRNSEEIKKCNE